MNTPEQIHQEDLQRLRLLRYMDDDFMTVCLADNFEGVELILRIVLDVHAVDSTGKEFDVEIQRSDAGAGAKKARLTAST